MDIKEKVNGSKFDAIRIISMVLLCSLLFSACKDSGVNPDPDEEEEETEEPADTTNYNYESSAPYNLNVVYFTPSDVDTTAGYHKRLSGVMLYLQDYVNKWMKHWGYGDKSFGLMVDQEYERVKITHVTGDQTHTAYPYEGGGSKIKEEVQAYFDSNGEVSPTSDHYLVILPQYPNDDAPFYGLGKWAFAKDSGEKMSVENLGQPGEAGEQALWIGGLAHELGHGLNLPHNSHKVSEEQQFGTALMDNGNHVFDEETFLTHASASILNKSQTFRASKDNYYGSVDVDLTSLTAYEEGTEIVVEGEFTSSFPVAEIIVFQDPADRSNYNQIGWTTDAEGSSFMIQMSKNELFETSQKDYSMRIALVHEKGQRSFFDVGDYRFSDGQSNISFDYGIKETYSKSEWTIESFSSQEVGRDHLAEHIIDDDFNTYWHSRWSDVDPNTSHPHTITVDAGETIANATGFQFVQRRDGMRQIKDLKIAVSEDGENWTSLGSFELADISLAQSLEPDALPDFRYFRLTTQSAWDGEEHAALAEVGVY